MRQAQPTQSFGERWRWLSLNTARLLLCGDELGLSLLVAPRSSLHAQSATADVVGTITDSSAAVVPNASMELSNLDTKEKRIASSGGAGEYTFTFLKPSRYALTPPR